ncbi:MAG: hypothetical protein R2827_08220 [Bdellovibrionales bacterium]
MIRINLINNKIKDANAEGGQGILITNDQQGQRESIIKAILMLIFVIGLYFYESHNLDQLTAEFKAVKAKADQGTAEIQKLRATAVKLRMLRRKSNN